MKRKLHITILVLAVCFLNLSWAPIPESNVKLVFFVNSSVSESELSKNQIEDIFFGDKTVWKNRNKITPCYIDGTHSTGRTFFKEFLNETPYVFNRHWVKLIFSGYSQAPKKFDNSKQIIEYVGEKAGAIGFISEDDKNLLKDNCKILTIR